VDRRDTAVAATPWTVGTLHSCTHGCGVRHGWLAGGLHGLVPASCILVIAGTAATAVRNDLQRAQSGAFSIKRTVSISGVLRLQDVVLRLQVYPLHPLGVAGWCKGGKPAPFETLNVSREGSPHCETLIPKIESNRGLYGTITISPR
jgi:hypothetical protein